jgi:hypothetical protein
LQLHTLPPKNYFSHFFAISNSYSEVAKTTTGKWLPHYNEKIETIGSAELRSLQKKIKEATQICSGKLSLLPEKIQRSWHFTKGFQNL